MQTDAQNDILTDILSSIDKIDIKEDLFSQGKSVIYDDETISEKYSVLETPFGEKFLVDLKDGELVKVKQIQ
ncbi:MAG: hypothetical protein LBT96_01035 [Campylobacteraceae bacterium]|nr:hypothetical protein [Campylobacteraceae bacterium]